jgi:dihydroflavonol-4-reductase
MMRAFVTGGSGLIGRHVVDALLDHGWDVTVLTRTRDRTRALEARGVAVVEGDVARPRFQSDLSRTDVLFHVAGWIDLGVRDARRMFDVNVTGTANILAMARKEGVSRVVFTGTAGVFAPAPPDRPARESSEARAPTHDPYVVTKFQAHSLVIGEMHAGLPVTVVLPAAVYGPGDTNALGRSLALLAKGRLRIVPRGFGHNTWTHAADIAEGHVLAATRGRPGEMYLLGDRVAHFMDFYRAAAKAARVKPPRARVPMRVARAAAVLAEAHAAFAGRAPTLSRAALELAALDLCVDATKARTELGWSPRPFDERIREAMEWYVQEYRVRGKPLPVKRGGASA